MAARQTPSAQVAAHLSKQPSHRRRNTECVNNAALQTTPQREVALRRQQTPFITTASGCKQRHRMTMGGLPTQHAAAPRGKARLAGTYLLQAGLSDAPLADADPGLAVLEHLSQHTAHTTHRTHACALTHTYVCSHTLRRPMLRATHATSPLLLHTRACWSSSPAKAGTCS